IGFVALLAAIQVGGTLWNARLDSYHNSYLPAMRFLDRNTTATDLIAGSADMIFALGRSKRLVDDIHLGKYSGAIPDIVVIEEAYRRDIQGIASHSAADWTYDQTLISQCFRLVYDHSFYQIYRRSDQTAALGVAPFCR